MNFLKDVEKVEQLDQVGIVRPVLTISLSASRNDFSYFVDVDGDIFAAPYCIHKLKSILPINQIICDIGTNIREYKHLERFTKK